MYLIGLLTVLFIIIFCLYTRETAAQRKLAHALDKISAAEKELSDVKAGLCGQETVVGKCHADLSSCEGKSAETEVKIAGLSAELEEAREKLSAAEADLKLHKHLTFELKRAVDNAPCGFGIAVPSNTVEDQNTARLLTRIDDQRHLIHQLRMQIVDREARLNGLTARLFAQHI
jgi:hypothetical protein